MDGNSGDTGRLAQDELELRTVGICHACLHLYLPEAEACDAFPGGIPPPVRVGRNDHHFPYPGDHGIRFEAAK